MRLWRCAEDADASLSEADSASFQQSPGISGLSAQIIPQREFPLRKWYYATPLWYYHAPAVEHTLQRDPEFFKLVDPQLRDLCRIVLEAGLCTTPSCQGHFYLPVRFAKIWEQLQREQDLIRGGGLTVKDAENHASFLFADSQYTLPWRTFDEFLIQAASHQSEGYVGIAIPPPRAGLVDPLCRAILGLDCIQIQHDADLSQILGQPLVGITVRAADITARDTAWSAVTRHVKAVLDSESHD